MFTRKVLAANWGTWTHHLTVNCCQEISQIETTKLWLYYSGIFCQRQVDSYGKAAENTPVLWFSSSSSTLLSRSTSCFELDASSLYLATVCSKTWNISSTTAVSRSFTKALKSNDILNGVATNKHGKKPPWEDVQQRS